MRGRGEAAHRHRPLMFIIISYLASVNTTYLVYKRYIFVEYPQALVPRLRFME